MWKAYCPISVIVSWIIKYLILTQLEKPCSAILVIGILLYISGKINFPLIASLSAAAIS